MEPKTGGTVSQLPNIIEDPNVELLARISMMTMVMKIVIQNVKSEIQVEIARSEGDQEGHAAKARNEHEGLGGDEGDEHVPEGRGGTRISK